jgi:hypothetical protein
MFVGDVEVAVGGFERHPVRLRAGGDRVGDCPRRGTGRWRQSSQGNRQNRRSHQYRRTGAVPAGTTGAAITARCAAITAGAAVTGNTEEVSPPAPPARRQPDTTVTIERRLAGTSHASGIVGPVAAIAE